MKEILVYIVMLENLPNNQISDNEFITIAEDVGHIYSLKDFQNEFNVNKNYNPEEYEIRFFESDKKPNDVEFIDYKNIKLHDVIYSIGKNGLKCYNIIGINEDRVYDLVNIKLVESLTDCAYTEIPAIGQKSVFKNNEIFLKDKDLWIHIALSLGYAIQECNDAIRIYNECNTD